MYGYYALAAMGIKMPFGWSITILQTAQMVVGIVVLALTPRCADSWSRNWHGNIAAGAMYSVYLALFAKLLLQKLGVMAAPERKEKKQ